MDQPVWMAEAWQQLGKREVAGRRHNHAILDFFRDAGRGDITRDEVPWCAAFVGACLERTGSDGTGSLMARSYLNWGEVLAYPRLGAVVVLKRGTDPHKGHVGFWVGETEDAHLLLGGNQSDAVTVASYSKERLLGFRWPREGAQRPGEMAQAPDTQGWFERALEHVLEMEGGFTDDPDDPGGPTNKGIILEVYCRHTGRTLSAATRGQRVAELREISSELVEDIYRKRYWRPSRASSMPAAIAFMHFDASVNQGLTGAARLLQQAANRQGARLDVDGEVGPLTLAAVEATNEARLLMDYGEERRAKYRSLRHFWKFGRGWLRRVDRSEERALALVGRPATRTKTENQSSRKGHDMSTTDTSPESRKWWGRSMTIWGAAITAMSTVVPILGPALGFDVTPDLVRQTGEQFVTVIQAVGGLAGTIMTIYGRARASNGLERRNIQLHL